MVVSVNRTALNEVCEEVRDRPRDVFSVPLPFPGLCAADREVRSNEDCSESIGKSSSSNNNATIII